MSIIKTYMVRYKDYETDKVSYLKRRALSMKQLETALFEEFGEPFGEDGCWRIEGRYATEEKFRHIDTSTFPYNTGRHGQYTYRHKGRKQRGRKNYPPKYWRRSRAEASFVYTESVSRPVSEFLQSWVDVALASNSEKS